MKILSFLICDSDGHPFFTKYTDDQLNIDKDILSGYISAISYIGRNAFKRQIAMVSYGMDQSFKIIVIHKDLFNYKKSIYFVFFVKDDDIDISQTLFNRIEECFTIFLKNYQNLIKEKTLSEEKIITIVSELINIFREYSSLNLNEIKKLSTDIFIQTKQHLIQKDMPMTYLEEKINKILKNYYI